MSSDLIFSVRAEKFVGGGECLGRLPDGRAVFIPFAIPGELVQIELVLEHKRYARARLLAVLEPAPNRIPPRCLHFGLCGGCHYQHLPYTDQLAAKRAVLVEQLERIGGLANPPVETVVGGPAWNYRVNLQFHLTTSGALGFFAQGGEQVFPLEECHLPVAEIAGLWPQLEFDPETPVERIGLRAGVDEDLQIILEGVLSDPPEMRVEGLPVSVALVEDDVQQVLAGSPALEMEAGGRRFQVSAGSFFQVNPAIAGEMVAHLEGLLDWDPDWTVWELYAGVGLFSASLALRVGELLCVEANELACDDFAANLDEFDNVSLYSGPAEAVVPYLPGHPQVVVLDPPRAGMDREVLSALLEQKPDWIVYISCDPATLGRDSRQLQAGGYSLGQVKPFDMFPQTHHIESISLWGKKQIQ